LTVVNSGWFDSRCKFFWGIINGNFKFSESNFETLGGASEKSVVGESLGRGRRVSVQVQVTVSLCSLVESSSPVFEE
jgi:hypothetical protein